MEKAQIEPGYCVYIHNERERERERERESPLSTDANPECSGKWQMHDSDISDREYKARFNPLTAPNMMKYCTYTLQLDKFSSSSKVYRIIKARDDVHFAKDTLFGSSFS